MSPDEKKVIEVLCPCCRTLLWIDPATGTVVRFEKSQKKRESLDELLVREKKKKEGFATKFEATADLERQKLERAREKFEKEIGKLDKD